MKPGREEEVRADDDNDTENQLDVLSRKVDLEFGRERGVEFVEIGR